MFRGETITSLKNCTDFKSTHGFFVLSLFVCTGKDFTSFFSGLAKQCICGWPTSTMHFINADSEQFPRSLALRLRKRVSWPFLGSLEQHTIVGISFVFPLSLQEPSAILLDLAVTPGQHKVWLEYICTTNCECTEFENSLPPSVEALWQHGSNHAGCLNIGVKLWRTVTVCWMSHALDGRSAMAHWKMFGMIHQTLSKSVIKSNL